ncbi:MAG TPA: hypothetical protein VKS20_12190 [Candidatus Acidoferrales bacterium]|jgi:hypothetical protein|nr:hypothetical protein [Candidatus Acidoferrales bacterium]HLW82786.1 hypothetical protein [Candidatus Acidoferrales bacterium]
MDTFHVTSFAFLIASGVVLAAWFCLIIYRGTIEAHEDDQLFLADQNLATEQREVVARIERINPIIRAVMITWILLAAVSAGLWIWQGFKSF